jgi:hypothetical protein
MKNLKPSQKQYALAATRQVKTRCPINLSALIGLLLAPLAAIHAADNTPQIIQASDPVRPDETVLAIGEGFGNGCTAELGQLADGPITKPQTDLTPAVKQWVAIQPLQTDARSLKFVVPKSWPPGVWAFRVRQGGDVSAPAILNAPDPWWWNGDGGEFASPGGWLRVFGKSLSFGGESRALLRGVDGRSVTLATRASSGYALNFPLPADIPAGNYTLAIHNGLGGDASWRPAGSVTVRPPTAWKNDVFNVKDFGPKPAEALLAALAKAKANGGGIVYLPRGRYLVRTNLTLPPNTVLRGEATELVSLYWPDFEKPPAELVSGADFGLESLSLYCQHHRNVIADTAASKRVFLHGVRIRANCYFMIEDAGKEFRKRRGPASHRECGAAVLLRGMNFEITDCDIYASNYGIRILGAKTGIIARNQIRYGGRGYSFENTERLIFEDNLVAGNNLLAIGNDISTFWNNYCRHIYYASNRVQQVFGADREMMTLDAASGAYFGKVAAVSGTQLTLAGDPVFKDYTPKPHTNWIGGVVQVLDGKGAGQYRFVTANQGREWEVDRPWTVVPDEASLISIAPFRGRNLFLGNTFEDGGAVQLYAAAHDTIVAGNKGSRMDGFQVWGLNPHGWGLQPSWFCQFLDNEILEGNGYGHRTASFGTIAYDESKIFDGPLVRGAIFRRNICRNNASFHIGSATADTLVEHCVVRHAEIGIKVAPGAKGVLLRGNEFEDVAQPEVTGP